MDSILQVLQEPFRAPLGQPRVQRDPHSFPLSRNDPPMPTSITPPLLQDKPSAPYSSAMSTPAAVSSSRPPPVTSLPTHNRGAVASASQACPSVRTQDLSTNGYAAPNCSTTSDLSDWSLSAHPQPHSNEYRRNMSTNDPGRNYGGNRAMPSATTPRPELSSRPVLPMANDVSASSLPLRGAALSNFNSNSSAPPSTTSSSSSASLLGSEGRGKLFGFGEDDDAEIDSYLMTTGF